MGLLEQAWLRHWQQTGTAPALRLLSAATPLVGAEPELAEMGPDGLAVAWRIFRKGWNESRNGPALFDDLAAELVMADYREHGARVQVDMDHVSLNKNSPFLQLMPANSRPRWQHWQSMALNWSTRPWSGRTCRMTCTHACRDSV